MQQEENPRNYWLANSEIEACFLSEIAERENVAEKRKRLATISDAVGIELITTTIVTGSLSIPIFVSVWALVVEVNLLS